MFRKINIVIIFIFLAAIVSTEGAVRTSSAKKDIEVPIVGVRVSQVVAGFKWAMPHRYGGFIFDITGSVMDATDALNIRQEMILPAIIWEKNQQFLIIGLQWFWRDLFGNQFKITVLQPDKNIRYRPIAMDERIGLLLAEPYKKNTKLKPLKIGLNKFSADEKLRMVCIPSARSFEFVPTHLFKGRNHSYLTGREQKNIPVLLPVLDINGQFDGYCIPFDPERPSENRWVYIPRENIIKRVKFLRSTRMNVKSGYLGVYLGEKRAMAGREVFIRKVVENSPADIAGLQSGDYILSINGLKIDSVRETVHIIKQFVPNSLIRLKLKRQGKIIEKKVLLGRNLDRRIDTIPIHFLARLIKRYKIKNLSKSESTNIQVSTTKPTMGIFVKDPSMEIKQILGWPNPNGVLITYLLPGFGGYLAGLRAGDLIISIENHKITSTFDITSLLKNHQKGDTLKVTVWRKNVLKRFLVKLR